MKVKRILGTNENPNVILDKDKNKFVFSGKSLPENVKTFYTPILDWVEEYVKDPNSETIVKFDLEYFNSSSSKQLISIIQYFSQIVKNKRGKLIIRWCYMDDDDDIEETGIAFSEIVGIPFEMVRYSQV